MGEGRGWGQRHGRLLSNAGKALPSLGQQAGPQLPAPKARQGACCGVQGGGPGQLKGPPSLPPALPFHRC